jgi:hypothetical protein
MGYKIDRHGTSLGSGCGCVSVILFAFLAWAFFIIPAGAPGVWERTSWLDVAVYVAIVAVIAFGLFRLVKSMVDSASG